VKDAIKGLKGDQILKIGCQLGKDTDAVVILDKRSDVEALIDALLNGAKEDDDTEGDEV
jgi:hypothetical protein